MTRVYERPSGWFKLSATFYADSKIMRVSGGAELLFVRMLALCSATASGGVLTNEQVQLISRGIRSVRAACAELIEADLLEPMYHGARNRAADAEQSQSNRSGIAEVSQTNRRDVAEMSQTSRRPIAEVSQTNRRDVAEELQGYRIKAYQRWNFPNGTSGEETAGQRQRSIDSDPEHPTSSRARTGAGPRGKTDREKETVTSRPASPDGRDVTVARAAPRAADAATRPAPDEDQKPEDQKPKSTPGCYMGPARDNVPDHPALVARRLAKAAAADTMDKDEALAMARAAVAQFQQLNPNSRGSDTPLSRWENGRELRPLKNNLFGEEPE